MSKIIFSDGAEFSAATYPIETEPPIFSKKFLVSGEQRETLRITVIAAYAEVAAKFISGAAWAIRQQEWHKISERQLRENPDTPIEELSDELELVEVDYDKSDYCVCGDIVDHRDGRVTVYMGKKTESEKMRDTIDQLVLEALGGIV